LDEDGLLTGRHRLGVANQITLAQEVEDPFFDAAALVNLGIVHVLEGHAAEGIAAFQRGLEVTTGIGSTYLAVSSLDGLAAALEESIQQRRLGFLQQATHLERARVSQGRPVSWLFTNPASTRSRASLLVRRRRK
jgi:hypothetical protein